MSIADTSVKYIHEGMRGAPVLNGTASALITLLDTFLKDGWGLATALSATVLDGVCTVTMNAADVFEDGCVIAVAGATPATLNGEHRLTQGGNILKFETVAPNGPVTGTITVKYAPLNWAKPFSGPNVAGYKSLDITSPQRFLRVDDSNAQFARVVGYNDMTDANTGTGPFPTTAQVSGGLYWYKSTSSNATARKYTLWGDGAVFYYAACPNTAATDTNDALTATVVQQFGYGVPFSPTGDVWATVISGFASANWASLEGGVGIPNQPGIYIERAPNGTGAALQTTRRNFAGGSASYSGGDNTFGPFPGVIDGRLRLSPIFAALSTSDFTQRVTVAGAYAVPHSGLTAHPSLRARDTVPGTGQLAGRRLMLKWIGGGGARSGGMFFDATGPWR